MDLKEKEAAARKEIEVRYDKPEGEFGPTLFVSHHLEEVETEYWVDVYGTEMPEPSQILGELVLKHAWSSADDGVIDVLDFSLPNDITDYVLSVRFIGSEIASIDMES